MGNRFNWFLLEVSLFIVFCGVARLYTQGVVDLSFLPNVLIQTPSVMVGFAALATFFLVQTSLEAERHVASEYLILCLEVQKAKSANVTGNAGSNPELTDPTRLGRQVIDQLEISLRDERNFRRLSLDVLIFVIVSFTLSLLTSVFVPTGSWGAAWLPMAFFLLGFLDYPFVLLWLVAYLYSPSTRPELKLKEPTVASRGSRAY